MRQFLFALCLIVLLFNGVALAQEGSGTVITATNVRQLELQQTIGNGRVLDMQWSADGVWFGVLTARGVWIYPQDGLSGEPILIGEAVAPVLSFAFDPNNPYVILGHRPLDPLGMPTIANVTAWTIPAGEFVYALTTEQGDIVDVAVSADGTRLATADVYLTEEEAMRPRIKLLDMSTFTLLTTIEDEDAGGYDFGNILFADKYLATNLYTVGEGFLDTQVALWNSTDGTFASRVGLQGTRIWGNGQQLASVGFRYTDAPQLVVCNLDCQNPTDYHSFDPTFSADLFPNDLALVDDSHLLVIMGTQIFSAALATGTLTLAKETGLPLEKIAVNPANGMVSVLADGFFLHYADLISNAKVTTPFFNRAVQDILIHPESGQIFAIEGNHRFGFTEGKLVIWDGTTGAKISEIADSTFMSMSFDTTYTQVGLGDISGRVFIYDLMTQQIEIIPISEECGVVGVAFHPDNTRLATVEAIPNNDCRTNPVKIYSLLDGIATPLGAPENPVDLLYGTNGQLFLLTEDAFAFGGGTTVPVDASQAGGGGMELRDLALSPNSQILVATGQMSFHGSDGTSGLWKMDAATGALTYADAHSAPIRGSAISPDSALIATASADGTVNIYAAEDLTLLHTIPMYGGANAVQFSANGTQLYIAGEDGTIRVWGLP